MQTPSLVLVHSDVAFEGTKRVFARQWYLKIPISRQKREREGETLGEERREEKRRRQIEFLFGKRLDRNIFSTFDWLLFFFPFTQPFAFAMFHFGHTRLVLFQLGICFFNVVFGSSWAFSSVSLMDFNLPRLDMFSTMNLEKRNF